MKRRIDDLAIFGGQEAFLRPLLVGRPTALDRGRFFERLEWALNNEWLTNGGPLSSELEARIADLTGARHCVVTANGTLGLQILAHAAELTGEVIVPSFTFPATAHAFRWVGLDPIFCDVDPTTGCVDVASAEAVITERTSAIVGVHIWGRLCDVDGLRELAAAHDLRLLFDGAHALGCTTAAGRPIGGFGDATMLSFHATKVAHAFEGGAVVTNDAYLAERMRGLRNFGIGVEGGHPAGGTNAKMSEASAAACLTSLEAFPSTVAQNRENYQTYSSELKDLPGVRFVTFPAQENNNHNYVIVLLDEEVAGVSRNLLMQVLAAEGVVAKTYFAPACHQLEPYSRGAHRNLPVTEKLANQVIALPTGTRTGTEDIRRICSIIRIVTRNGPHVTARDRKLREETTAKHEAET